MTEFEDFEPLDTVPVQEPEPEPATPFEREIGSRLLTAAMLVEDDPEPAELGFEPDNRYLSFQIIGEEEWPDVLRHQLWRERFYVKSPRGTIGVVPWAGSRIVWPWEEAWQATLHREQVVPVSKEPEKKKK